MESLDTWQKEFLDKYESFAQLVAKVYPTENIPSVAEMRDLLASLWEIFLYRNIMCFS